MLSRRSFLKRAAALVAMGVAADQIELIEKLDFQRSLFSGWTPVGTHGYLEALEYTKLRGWYAAKRAAWNGESTIGYVATKDARAVRLVVTSVQRSADVLMNMYLIPDLNRDGEARFTFSLR